MKIIYQAIIILTFAELSNMIPTMELNKGKIKKELTRLGWSYFQFGEKMGVKRQWVYQLMDPKYNGVTLKTVQKLADALDFDPKDLII